MEKQLEKLFDILTQIKEQNSEILAALAPKTIRKYLSAEETAERLNRSAWTIRQLCNSGLIKAIKGNDRCWRIPSDEIERLEQEGVPTLPRRDGQMPVPLSVLPDKQDVGDAVSHSASFAQGA